MPGFVHLSVHSEFSLVDGLIRPKVLAQKVAEYGQPAVALTDFGNLYAMVKFYKACIQNGVKPIIGSDLWVRDTNTQALFRMTLLCRNNAGFQSLSELITDSYLNQSAKAQVAIDYGDLLEKSADLIAIMDEHQGLLAQANNKPLSKNQQGYLEALRTHFVDRMFFAVSRIGKPTEEQYIRQAAEQAAKMDVGLVATNRVQFIDKNDFDAHEVRVCIHEGRVLEDPRRERRYTEDQYLRSDGEMQALFSDIPEALENTVEIAKCCNVFFNFSENFLPDYPDTNGLPVSEVLERDSKAGLAKRLKVAQLYDENGNALVHEDYLARLKFELDTIETMGFPGYFLIVADFIRWSKENDIPVGPGRGSGAGSLVAWAIGITELDPLEYGLLFERFLNPDRVSLPDFDIDFCVDGRDRVIDYVVKRYGAEQVAQIITFGTMAAKAVVRDVGRVLGFPYGFVDGVAKLIPFEIGMTLDKALEQEAILRERYAQEEEIQTLIDMALQLEGITRNVGKHAGGVVIAPRALTCFNPLYFDQHLPQPVTQLDKDDLEEIGLVKFDFLGLRTLTIIDNAVRLANQQNSERGHALIDMDTIALDDLKTFEMIQAGNTTAVFQLESRGMKELIIKLVPDQFDELVALVALFRPGPLQSGMVDDFIDRKHGREPIIDLHPDIADVLASTYGVILYQEQVMQIAQILAGYTLGNADILRRAMGKKKPEEMEKQRVMFTEGAEKRGVEAKVATHIFDLMEKFAGYGFNKSHSAAYAMLSYQTAWLKANYSSAFMAATLSADMDNTDKVVRLLADCKQMNIDVSPPNINACWQDFRPVSEHEILYGLAALKGVGHQVVEDIVAEREANGAFASIYDFCARLDSRTINKRLLEALIKGGAMDALGPHRAQLISQMPNALKAADQARQASLSGQFDLFGESSSETISQTIDHEDAAVAEWTEEVRLIAEKEVLGLYLTGHPYQKYQSELAGLYEQDLQSLDLTTPKPGLFAGLIIGMRVMKTRRGKMAVLTLDNAKERVEAVLFAEQYQEYFSVISKDKIVIVGGEMSTDDFTEGVQVRVEKLLEVDELRSKYLKSIRLVVEEAHVDEQVWQQLHDLLTSYRGNKVAVELQYKRKDQITGVMSLGDAWKINPDQMLINELLQCFGRESVRYHYSLSQLRSDCLPEKNNRQYWRNKR